MKIHISKLEGLALNRAVATCEDIFHAAKGGRVICDRPVGESGGLVEARYSSDWAAGGPIIERERIYITDWPSPKWRAGFNWPRKHANAKRSPSGHPVDGATPLEAAMRCYVVSVLGDEGDFIEVIAEVL